MKILAIGNSFSQDATRYLHGIAEAAGEDLFVTNLYIGGCSLERHYNNIIGSLRDYTLEINGKSTGRMVSSNEMLDGDEYDVITIQQVSHKSTKFDTYEPYLSFIADYIRIHQPKAKLYIHQTWAYEDGSEKLLGVMGYEKRCEMFRDLRAAYDRAKERISADGLIPSGALFMSLLDLGIEKVHRDTFHASLGLGRYALGLLWYKVLTGGDVLSNTFASFDEPISEKDINIVKKCVHNIKF